MNMSLASQLGSFTVFGFTKSPEKLDELSNRLGISPSTIVFGDLGYFFFYASYGDVEETDEFIALKLGFARSPDVTPLSTKQLVHQKIVNPQMINHSALRGNALVACLGKTDASFSVYQTLLSAYQLHYAVSGEDILCSDSLRCLITALGHVELNEEIIPYHFGLMYVPGRLTYFKNIYRLFPGELLRWKEGNLDIQVAQDLRFADGSLRFDRADDRAIAIFHERFGQVMAAYVDDAEKPGRGGLGSFLSGGLDSSFLQFIINERASEPSRSFTYAPTRTPSFEFEIEYARQASDIFGTKHTFVEISPENFADLLVEATDILAQPVLSDPEPNKLGLAQHLARNVPDLHCFVNGLASGALFGGKKAQKLRTLEMLDRVPASGYALGMMGRLFRPFTPRAQALLNAADRLPHIHDLNSFKNLINTTGTHAEFGSPRRFLGDASILKAFQYRQDLERQYLDSPYLVEKAYTINLITFCYEIQVQSQRLFLSQNIEQIYPYLDEDIIRLAYAFHPLVRYTTHSTYKYPLKRILAQQPSSEIIMNRNPKGGSLVYDDLLIWMNSGPLQELVRDIRLPGFLSRKDFEDLIEHPNSFLWCLLTFDIFKKRFL